jgi:hypothetical protein
VYIQDDEDCGLEPFDIEFDLGLKCPIRANGEKKISIGLNWGETQEKQEKKYTDTQNDEEDCSITPIDVDFDLELPCPISDVSDSMKISLKWGQQQQPVQKDLKIKKVEDCGLEIEAPDFDLELPCPIPDTVKDDIKIELKWQDKKSDTQPITIKKAEDDDCSLEIDAPDFDLGLPCPIPNNDIKLKPSITWGAEFKAPAEVLLAHGDASQCATIFHEPEMNLEIPCPLDNLNFSGKIHEGSTNSIDISKNPNGNCGLDVNIDLTIAKEDLSNICVNSFLGISGSGATILVYYEKVCMDGTRSGPFEVPYTLPTTPHVNKCCDCE